MIKAIKSIIKYWEYITYATKLKVKSEVINSSLGFLWLILEPFCFMLIYMYIATVVFKTEIEYFPLFVCVGMIIWNFFSKSINTSTKVLTSNKDIISKIYVPKILLLLIVIFQNIVKLLISFALVIGLLIYFQVPFQLNMFSIFLVLLVLFIFTTGVAAILMHFGVFMTDLNYIVSIFLKFLFYLTGVFYVVSTMVPPPYNEIISIYNPLAFFIIEIRNVLLYNQSLNYYVLASWAGVAIFLNFIGTLLINKYENTYVKVMK